MLVINVINVINVGIVLLFITGIHASNDIDNGTIPNSQSIHNETTTNQLTNNQDIGNYKKIN